MEAGKIMAWTYARGAQFEEKVDSSSDNLEDQFAQRAFWRGRNRKKKRTRIITSIFMNMVREIVPTEIGLATLRPAVMKTLIQILAVVVAEVLDRQRIRAWYESFNIHKTFN